VRPVTFLSVIYMSKSRNGPYGKFTPLQSEATAAAFNRKVSGACYYWELFLFSVKRYHNCLNREARILLKPTRER
jgi:hypothetical protein